MMSWWVIEQQCRQQHVTVLFLDVAEDNTPAIRLYEKKGFVLVQRRMGGYPRGETSLMMKKEL